MKIIYTHGNRTEHLASIATLRNVLDRFVGRRVFYEVSSRNKRGHEFFSAKNRFVVGNIEVTHRERLSIIFFDKHSACHSVEVLDPSSMRIYDEAPGRGFAVAFVSESDGGTESRCYIRDEGEVEPQRHERSTLDAVTLPQLLAYVDEIRRSPASTDSALNR